VLLPVVLQLVIFDVGELALDALKGRKYTKFFQQVKEMMGNN